MEHLSEASCDYFVYINQCIHCDQYPVLYIHLKYTPFNKYFKLHQSLSFYILLQSCSRPPSLPLEQGLPCKLQVLSAQGLKNMNFQILGKWKQNFYSLSLKCPWLFLACQSSEKDKVRHQIFVQGLSNIFPIDDVTGRNFFIISSITQAK